MAQGDFNYSSFYLSLHTRLAEAVECAAATGKIFTRRYAMHYCPHCHKRNGKTRVVKGGKRICIETRQGQNGAVECGHAVLQNHGGNPTSKGGKKKWNHLAIITPARNAARSLWGAYAPSASGHGSLGSSRSFSRGLSGPSFFWYNRTTNLKHESTLIIFV